jgi:hypothetical protein
MCTDPGQLNSCGRGNERVIYENESGGWGRLLNELEQ